MAKNPKQTHTSKMGKQTKSSKRFSKQGNIKSEISKRRTRQKLNKQSSNRAAFKKLQRDDKKALIAKTENRKNPKKRAAPTSSEGNDLELAKGKDVAGLSVDDFMSEQFLQSSEDESEDEDRKIKSKKKSSKPAAKRQRVASKKKTSNSNSESNSDSDSDSDSDDNDMDMQAVAASDPEFAKFMAENDPGMMDFKTQDSDDAADSESDEDADTNEQAKQLAASNTEILTKTKLSFLVKAAFEERGLGGLRNIVRAFAAATHMTDVDSKVASSYHYVITSSEVYNDLMMVAVSKLHEAFTYHLPTKTNALPNTSKKWSALQVIVKSFLKNFLHLMAGVTETSMLLMLINNVQPYVPFIASIPILPKRYLRDLLKIWSTTSKSDLRMSCFLSIRQMAIVTPFPFVEQCMKGLYLSFVRNAKVMNEQSRPAVAMMAKCIVELLGTDLVAAYQHAFVYIRQLAIHLRNAIKNKSKDAYAAVFNWQYMNCLMVWAAVISTYPGENQLQPLMYPLVQIIIGTVNLVPAARYFPMRFHCIELLNKMSAATSGTLIPIPSLLIDVLRCPEFGKSSPSTRKPPMMEYLVKVSTKELQTKSYQEVCITKALELLENHFQIHKWSISFPELAHSTVAALRKFSRDSQVSSWRQRCKAAMIRIQKQSVIVENKRNSASFGPKDLEDAKNFMSTEANQAHRKFLEEQVKLDEAKGKVDAKKEREQNARDDKKEKDATNKKSKGSSKTSTNKKTAAQPIVEREDDGEDVVEDMVLSDSDDE